MTNWIKTNSISKLVSVVVPTYNRRQFITDALGSVWKQLYRPIELVVVDDGSTDNTCRVVKKWKENHKGDNFEVKYIFQKNEGASAARNKGIVNSRGEYIQFLDSDDLLHPQKLELHVEALRQFPEASQAWSSHKLFSGRGEVAFKKYDQGDLLSKIRYTHEAAFGDFPVTLWRGIWRRSAIIATGLLNEKLPRWNDVEYAVRLAASHPTCCEVPATLYFQRSHEQSRITDMRRSKEGVQPGLMALKSAEQALRDKGEQESDSWYNMRGFYFMTLQSALRSGTRKNVREALEGAIRHSRSGMPTWTLKLFNTFYKLFGLHPSKKLFDLYTHFPLGLNR